VRYLHFGSEWIQGAMRLARPDQLELEYQQQMMGPLLFLPQPHRVLQLGLGAAALTRFCHRHLPRAHVTVVELSAAVVEVARQWFGLPMPDERLTVALADARTFIGAPEQRSTWDWLQVDLYDRAARGPVYDDPAFYRLCRNALRSPGIAAFNLFGSRFGPSFERIAAAFDQRAVVLPATAAGNRVVLAFAGPPLHLEWAILRRQARWIRSEFDLPAARWLAGLREQGDSIGLVI
jgi:spermidine synthase